MTDHPVRLVRTEDVPTAVAAADPTVRDAGPQWRPLLDEVWAFLRDRPGLWKGGHNLMLYAASGAGAALVEAGVQVTGTFEAAGRVRPSSLPACDAATTVHTGPITEIGAAHAAVRAWCADQARTPTGRFWEVYDDPDPRTGQIDVEVYWELRS
ncbi:hypothetical protein SCMU_36050 [Sinomonas cyclohexanicum]|uniref:GyrI-like small molecule binding domain-containing protein n=1 Tax=Sinomonas cyclohexanicum TaxID=322009 RepID=A0ABN6FLX7_SINCY|nr:GyrI-like domain-containing protein [Corynebacterium cyclohexanicum]BCT77763.1 hypothetical protein SCMU_36050 [Corynebacterium cyclohexanicum]